MLKSDICDTIDGVGDATTEEALRLGIKHCYWTSTDYWAGAVRECGGVDHMPDLTGLANLANALYAKDGVYDAGTTYSNNSGHASTSSGGYTYQNTNEVGQFLASYGLDATVSNFTLWTKKEFTDGKGASERKYFSDHTNLYVHYNETNRNSSTYSVICIAKD